MSYSAQCYSEIVFEHRCCLVLQLTRMPKSRQPTASTALLVARGSRILAARGIAHLGPLASPVAPRSCHRSAHSLPDRRSPHSMRNLAGCTCLRVCGTNRQLGHQVSHSVPHMRATVPRTWSMGLPELRIRTEKCGARFPLRCPRQSAMNQRLGKY